MADVVGGVDDPALPRAVVYSDSFTDGLVPHLSERFREIRYIWGRYGAKLDQAPDFKPDIVIQIMADRVFRENVKYSPEIQEERLRRRIDAGSELIWRREAWTADLPPPRDARNHLPVIQVDLTARQGTTLELTWGKDGGGSCRVQPGRGRVLLPVLDPDATPPFRLRVKGRADDVEIHSVELREISR
jgi:hypothetical protein